MKRHFLPFDLKCLWLLEGATHKITTRKHEADPNLSGLVLGLVQEGFSLKHMAPSPLSLNLAHDLS